MSAPAPAARPGDDGGWPAVLDDFETFVERVERTLAGGAWAQATGEGWPAPPALTVAPTPAERARAQALLARAAACEQRLARTLTDRGSELADLEIRRLAGRRYHASLP